MSTQQTTCTFERSLNNQCRSFRNISELVVCDVRQEITALAKRYVNIILEYQNDSNAILPSDVLHGEVSHEWFLK